MRASTTILACAATLLFAPLSAASAGTTPSQYLSRTYAPWLGAVNPDRTEQYHQRDTHQPDPYERYTITVRLAKPNASPGEYRADREQCATAAGLRGLTSPSARQSAIMAFVHCMKSKGYRTDPSGFEAISFRPLRGTSSRVYDELASR